MSALAFVATLVLLESLVIGPLIARAPEIAAALFWIALVFAAILATTRSFDREIEDDALDAVLVLPGGRDAIYLGKTSALALLLALVALGGGALTILMLDLGISLVGHLFVVMTSGILALAPVVVLGVTLTLRLRARAALVPIIALPILLPALVSATQGTAAALAGDATGALGWSGMLVAFALVYAVLGLTIVPATIE